MKSHPKPNPQDVLQLLPPHPHPKLKPPPQQHRRIRIQRMLPPPLPPVVHSHPQPQFVAAKSLILVPPEIFFTVYHMNRGLAKFPLKVKSAPKAGARPKEMGEKMCRYKVDMHRGRNYTI